MSSSLFPFAVRIIGFSAAETRQFEDRFSAPGGAGYGYFVLAPDNLQDPDLYVCRATDTRALVQLSYLTPSDARPALLVGTPQVEMPYSRVHDPIRWPELIDALDRLVEKRADALSRLEASDIVLVPERRRHERLDRDLTDPAEYVKMRARIPEHGMVLVVDKSPALSDYLSDLLVRQRLPVQWVSDEASALAACEQNSTAVVFINTSTPGLDPYRVCSALKEKGAPLRTAVVFLVSKPFVYDMERGRRAGVDGFLNKPLASQHLISTLKKFVPRLY